MTRELKLGVLTYNVKHRKTYDVLCLLKSLGYKNVNVYAAPFHYKKSFQPLIEHRPKVIMNIPEIECICNNFGYSYRVGKIDEFEICEDEILLLCGAGLLPEEFIKTHVIINAHPGFIPNSRGLDALKWAIYNNEPIGVTTHLLGQYVDAGSIIERRLIDFEKSDTFHTIAQKVYENEISMLIEAIDKINGDLQEIIPSNDSIVYRRMPHEKETQLLHKFEERKERELKRNGIS